MKSTAEQRQRNAENIQKNRQERRDRLQIRKEQKWKRKEDIQNQRLSQQQLQLKRVVRHHKDPLGLNVLSDLLVGHHGFLNNHHELLGYNLGLNDGHHGGHGHRKGHGFHGGSHNHFGNHNS